MDRILAHVVRQDNDCWIWQGTVDKRCPVIRVSEPTRKLVSARRYAYEKHNQVCVPKEYVITNICKNSLCLNPAHLTAQMRGCHGHRKVLGWKVEHCKRGHEFSVWNTGTQANGRICLACDRMRKRVNMRAKRLSDPEHEKVLRDQRISKLRDAVNELKTCCNVCGENDVVLLDFHHIDPTTKDITIANAVRSQWTIERIKIEISKCIVLCANCHRKLHAAEKKEKD
jgi:hypothetical protein